MKLQNPLLTLHLVRESKETFLINMVKAIGFEPMAEKEFRGLSGMKYKVDLAAANISKKHIILIFGALEDYKGEKFGGVMRF